MTTNPQDIRNILVLGDRLLAERRAVEKAYQEAVANIAQQFAAATQVESYSNPFSANQSPAQVHKDFCAFARRQAGLALAPSGGVLEISSYELEERGVRPPEPDSDATIVGYWDAICAAYPTQEAHNTCFAQAALQIHRGLSLKPGTMKTVGGRVAIDISIYLETYSTGKHLHYNCRQNLFELAQGMASFEAWSGHQGVSAAFKTLAHTFSTHSRTINSRERLELSAGIQVITYFSRFEVRLPRSIAMDLNRFMGQFGEALAA